MKFWNWLGNVFETYIFIKFTLPLIILIIVGMLIWQSIYGSITSAKYKNDPNLIATSDLVSKVCDIAQQVQNKEQFKIVRGSDDNAEVVSTYSVEVEYFFKDSNKTMEEFDNICKNELTKIYNELKGKKIVKNQIFANTERKSIGLVFWCPVSYKTYSEIDGIYYDCLCSEVLIYKEETGFDEEEYNKQISNQIFSKEHYEYLKK